MRQWTEEARKRQSELIRRHKPWTKSTGPKTEEGKHCSSRNAVKHGMRSATVRKLLVVLAETRRFRRNAAPTVRLWHMKRVLDKIRTNELLCPPVLSPVPTSWNPPPKTVVFPCDSG